MWPDKRRLELYITWRDGWPMHELYAVLDGEPTTLDPLIDAPSLDLKLSSVLAELCSIISSARTGGGSPS